MSTASVVAVTRRLPLACEERLLARYRVRLGDDGRHFTADTLARFAEGASALIVTPAEVMDAAAIALLPPSIKIVATNSVGFEHVDLAAARARKIRVTNTPGVLTEATADLTLLLILAATRRAGEGERMMRENRWEGIRPTRFLGVQVTDKRLGIVGMGRIGAAVANRAKAFGMKILYHSRRPIPDVAVSGAVFVERLEALVAQSDILSLHCPLTKETANLIDARLISLMPPGSVIVNTARGGLIDDDALIAALQSGKLFAAGLDVYAHEPAIDPRYRTLDNAFLLPHVGSATVETRTAMGMLAIDNVEAMLEGREPPNLLV